MSRLSPKDWIAAGFRALTEQGPQALKAEAIARGLGTTKGSFYWHFKDVPAFQAEMLGFWEEHATGAIIAQLEQIPGAEAKLRALAQISTTSDAPYGGVGVEPAIRAWARSDASVADAVTRVDGARLAFLAEVFAQMGLTNPDLPRLYYAALVGLEDIAHGEPSRTSAPLETLTDMIIALSETD